MNKYFITLCMGVMATIIVLQQCGRTKPAIQPKSTITILHDTFYNTKDSIVYRDRLVPSKVTPASKEDTAGLALKPTDSCAERYNKLLNQFASTAQYDDTLRFDSSYIAVSDLIQYNKNKNRSYALHLKLPIVKTTIVKTVTLPKKRELYIGFGIGGNQVEPLKLAQTGLMYKDRNNRIFQLNVQAGADFKPVVVISRYWKL